MILLLLLSLLGYRSVRIQATDCLVYLPGSRRCSPSNEAIKLTRNIGLLHCMDMCINFGSTCGRTQWDTTKRTCYRLKTTYISYKKGNCLSFLRNPICQAQSDIVCMEKVPQHNFKAGIELANITSETNCKIVCTMWMSCTGVTWNWRRHTCNIHQTTQSNSVIPRRGDVYAVKNTTCRPRCLSMALHSHANGGWQTGMESYQNCVNLLLGDDGLRYTAMDFNYRAGRCWANTKMNPPLPLEDTSPIGHIYRPGNQACIPNKTEVCYRIHKGQMMDFGSVIADGMTEADCYNACIALNHCAGGTFVPGSGSCLHHRYHSPRINDSRCSMMEIIPCDSLDSTYSTQDGTTTATGVFKASYFIEKLEKTGETTTGKLVHHVSMLECATLCEREEKCQAFSYDTKIWTCRINSESKLRFVRNSI